MSQTNGQGLHWFEILKSLRQAAGVSQEVWANQLGIGRATLQRWERGETVPNEKDQETVVALCHEKRLIRKFQGGALQGLTVTDDFLRRALQEARGGTVLSKHAGEADSYQPSPSPASLTNRKLADRGGSLQQLRHIWVRWANNIGSIFSVLGFGGGPSKYRNFWAASVALAIIALVSFILVANFGRPFNSENEKGNSKTGADSFGGSADIPQPSPNLAIRDRVAVTAVGEGIPILPLPESIVEIYQGRRMDAGFEGEITNGPRIVDGTKRWQIKWVRVGGTEYSGWSPETTSDGTPWIQPLPGDGVFPSISGSNANSLVEVYRDAVPFGLPVRQAPGLQEPILFRLPAGSIGSIVDGPIIIDDYVWWLVNWRHGIQTILGWSRDSGLPEGVFMVREKSPLPAVTLSLFVRKRSAIDPVQPDARVTVWDAQGELHQETTNVNGSARITGSPGMWKFRISADGFTDNCWSDEIMSSDTKISYFVEDDTCND